MRVSPYKVREVLDLIRGHEVQRAHDILRLCERDAAIVVGKLLASAMANAEHNHALVTDELFVSACFADEGPTLKRWRPRARGRATRIRKRTCHVTVIVSRLPEAELRQRRAQRAQATTGRRGGARRTPATAGGGRPDRAGTGRGRRRDESSTSTSGSTTPATKGVDTGSFSTPPLHNAGAQQRSPRRRPPSRRYPPPWPRTTTTTTRPEVETITDSPEVRDEGPASGDAANEATEADVSEDDSSSDAEDKE